jgi:RNA polymerase sigma factor (sigma-70 family)
MTRPAAPSPADGDHAALINTLLERHLPGLRAFIRLRAGHVVREKEQTGDLVQSVCLEILSHQDRFRHDGEEGFRRWLYTTALREIINREHYYRAGKRDVAREERVRVTTGGPLGDERVLECYKSFCTPSREAVVREELQRIESAFDQMPDNYRAVITLSRIVGLSHGEIAKEMGTSEGNARVLLSRALARLSWILANGGRAGPGPAS